MEIKNIDWERLSIMANIMKRVEVLENGCWIYPSKARGQVRYDGVVTYVHRLSYCLWNGVDVSAEFDMRHLCMSEGKCVNPKHLEPGTRAVNMADKKYPPVMNMIKRLESLGYKVSK